MSYLTLAQTQEIIAKYAPNSYYVEHYRAYELENHPWVCEQIMGLKPRVVVDVGPGWGTMAVWLRSRGLEVHVLDFVDVGFFIAQKLLDDFDIHYHQVHIETDESLPELQADVITMTQVFGHLRYRPDNAIRRVCRLLGPAGAFVSTDLNKKCYPKLARAYLYWADMPLPGDGQETVADEVTCLFDEAEYRDLLDDCFSEVELGAIEGATTLGAVCRGPRGTTERRQSW